jgi:hypothetical protein
MLLPSAQLSVTVSDEENKPAANAEVIAWFPHIYGAGASPKGESVQVPTDRNGQVVLQGKTAGSVSFGARKEGYYETSGGKIDFPGMHQRAEPLKAEREVVLKAIRKPIPMYARPLREMKLPSLNTPFGFDLEVGDWVAPHGVGRTTDIIFEVSGQYASYRDHDLTLSVTFPNRGDGLVEFAGSANIGSQLRSGHLAPESGYRPGLTLRKKALHEQKASEWLNESKPGSNYYLRVRTVLDDDGNVVSANYGKIYGNIDFLDFVQAEAVYFNPKANDRNVEFDPGQNLADPKSFREQVRMP